jgi:O-antigen/teichoic acid export membrane protein
VTVKRNIVANLAGQGWSAIIGLVLIPVYIRYLGIEAYGLVGVFALVQACLSILDSGLTPTFSREMARFTAGAHTTVSVRTLLRTFEVLCFGLAIMIGLILSSISSHAANHWLNSITLSAEAVANALTVMAWGVAMRLCESFYRGALFGLQQQVWFNLANTVLVTLRYCGAVAVLAWVSPTITAFFAWQVAVSLVTILVFAVRLHVTIPKAHTAARFSRTSLIEVWPFASGMMITAMANILLTQTDKLLLSRLLSLENFSYYTLAAIIANIAYMITNPIVQAIYPRIVEHSVRGNETELASVYHYGAQIIVLLSAPAMLILCFFAEGVVFMWSGDAKLALHTAPILSALALSTFLNVLLSMPYHLQLAYGWTGFAFKCTLIALLFFAPAIVFVVPRYGALGAAWISVALYACYILGAVHFMHKRLLTTQKMLWYRDDVFLPLGAACASLVLWKQIEPANFSSRMEWLVFLMGCGICTFAITVAAANYIRPRVLIMVKGVLRMQ